MTLPNHKLLIQAYKYPPVLTPASLRYYYLSKFLSAYFPTIHVQTSAQSSNYPIDPKLVLPNIVLNQIPTRDIRSFYSRRSKNSKYPSLRKNKSIVYHFLIKLYHSFPIVFFFGDGGRTYIQASIQAASSLIEKEGITHLISSYRPWADHIIAYRLKKRFPHLVWIADFRDLPVDPVRRDVWWPRLQRWFQRRLLRRADIVTTVSDGLARHFQRDHPQVVVVRNGLAQLPNGFLTAPAAAHFTITYTGSLYPQLQSAAPLLSLLRELINEAELNPAHLELHYAGKDGATWQSWASAHGLGYLSHDHGMVPLAEAQALQRNSQLNLLLSWSADNYGGIMTAKLGSYLTAGRPIVTLLQSPPDPELTAAVEATGAGFVYPSSDPDSAARLRQFVLDAYRTWQFSGALPWRIQPDKLKPYTWEAQVDKLVAVL
ncbi:MAG: hypothetical protein C7N36_18325 [Bacteroidetes bacterium]|nr:MAG: hypothetical protein C7N36_18325 [Bacteroidota bacterium]